MAPEKLLNHKVIDEHVVHNHESSLGSEGHTGARQQLFDLLVFWHVLHGSVDLLPDRHHCTLPFQTAVSSVH